MSATGLPREVLKWIQGLDLSFSVRNVKRDFSNGFLVAEILSRYYPSDVTMHSFDNGSRASVKEDNWRQLKLFFTKIKFEFTDAEMKDIIHCRSLAIRTVMNRLYETITQKKLKEPPPPKERKERPGYTYPTASQVINDTFRGRRLSKTDTQENKHVAKAALEQHEMDMYKHKLEHAERYAPRTITPKNTINRVASRAVNSNENTTTNLSFVKQIEVKKVNETSLAVRNAAAQNSTLLNSQDFKNKKNLTQSLEMTSNSFQSGGDMHSPMSHASRQSGNVGQSDGMGVGGGVPLNFITIDQIFTAFLINANKTNLVEFNSQNSNWVSQVQKWMQAASDNAVANVFESLKSEILEQCCESAIASPREFWRFLSVLSKMFDYFDADSFPFESWVDFGTQLSVTLTGGDVNSFDIVFDLFSDFGAKSFISTLRSQPNKRIPILQFLSTFFNNDDQQISFLKLIQEELNDISTFVCCCTILATLQNSFSEQLLDVYVYYAVNGLSDPSPKARAAALATFSHILRTTTAATDVVTHTLKNVVLSMAEDDWWEIQAQVCVLCANFLRTFNSQHPISPLVYQTVNTILSRHICGRVIKIALFELCDSIANHEAMHDIYVISLLKFESIRSQLVNPEFQQTIPFSFGLQHSIENIKSRWHGWVVWKVIAKQLQLQQMGNFAPPHLQLVLLALDSVTEFTIHDTLQWKNAFVQLREYLLVELCDPNSCVAVVSALRRFFHSPNMSDEAIKLLDVGGSMDHVPQFFGVLKLVFPEGHQLCQETVFNFLWELNSNQSYSAAVIGLLRLFNEKCPIEFSQSILRSFLPIIQSSNDVSIVGKADQYSADAQVFEAREV